MFESQDRAQIGSCDEITINRSIFVTIHIYDFRAVFENTRIIRAVGFNRDDLDGLNRNPTK